MNGGKKDAVRVSEVLGCALLFSMLLLLTASFFLDENEGNVLFQVIRFICFCLPAVSGISEKRI